MFGRIKKTIQRRTTLELDDSNESGSSRRKGNRYALEQEAGYHAKLTDLAGFDACVEACDALAASSSLAQSGATDSRSGIRDCSITCSPDGDLVLLPHNQAGGEGEPTRAELNTIETETSAARQLHTGRLNNSDSGSIVMGNDLKPDRVLNGFSTLGWSAAASSLAIRQTESTSRNTIYPFIQSLRNVERRAIEDRAMACMQLRQTTGIGGIAIPSIPPTPLPQALRNSNRKDRKLAKVDLTSLSQTEPMGSSWNNSTTLEIGSNRVGPLLYAGGTIFSALASLETYHSRPHDHHHLMQLENILQALNQSCEETAERAYHREKTLNDMQTKVVEMEAAVKYAKEQAVKRWEMVHRAEEEATRIMENRMLERSRARERLRQEQIQREADLAGEENVAFATSAEIWDIVQAATANMEEGDFTPIDFPTAPMGGLRDQSSGVNTALDKPQTSDLSNTFAVENPMEISAGAAESMPTRAEVEQECNLPQLRAAAMAIEEVIDESSHSLLAVLSALDTTRRAARLSAETNLLQACQAQATSLRQIVKLERANLEERMSSLEALEKVVEQIDVRQDLDLYISADKKERGGSTWMGEDDDGGIASALAVLSSHVQGSTGIGASSIGWDDNLNESSSKVMSSEMLEDAVVDLFVEKPDGEYEKTIELLCEVAADRKLRSQRSSICYALNAKRTAAECHSLAHFNGLYRVFQSILSGCDNESSGVANAKMCMMLSQTFYINDTSADDDDDNVVPVELSASSLSLSSPAPGQRTKRIYIKSKLTDHDKWKEDEFWDHTLYQCVTESLTHSGVMQNFERSVHPKNQNSEWAERRKLKWYDLNHVERSEAAAQVHAVVFAQLGALAHSMMEFGCGLERSCAFVRRMSVRNQLPISQRSMLLQHLIKSNSNTKA